MTSKQKWYWGLDYFNNKISLLYSLCSCKIRSWSLRFCQFGVCRVASKYCTKNTFAQLSSEQWADFSTKIFARLWDPCSVLISNVMLNISKVMPANEYTADTFRSVINSKWSWRRPSPVVLVRYILFYVVAHVVWATSHLRMCHSSSCPSLTGTWLGGGSSDPLMSKRSTNRIAVIQT